jgi:outer membrane protein TolC
LIQKAENERADLLQKMYLEVMQAWNNVGDACSQYQLTGMSLQDAEANLRDVKADYDAGLVPVSDLLEAQTLYMQAQNERTDALIDLKIKVERYKTLTSNP